MEDPRLFPFPTRVTLRRLGLSFPIPQFFPGPDSPYLPNQSITSARCHLGSTSPPKHLFRPLICCAAYICLLTHHRRHHRHHRIAVGLISNICGQQSRQHAAAYPPRARLPPIRGNLRPCRHPRVDGARRVLHHPAPRREMRSPLPGAGILRSRGTEGRTIDRE